MIRSKNWLPIYHLSLIIALSGFSYRAWSAPPFKESGWKVRFHDFIESLFDPFPEKGEFKYSYRSNKEEAPSSAFPKNGSKGDSHSIIHSESTHSKSMRINYEQSLADERAKIAELETETREIREIVLQELGRPKTIYSEAFQDRAAYNWMSQFLVSCRQGWVSNPVFLAIGNSMSPLGDLEKKQIFDLARTLYNNGNPILYDYDSQAAPTIQAAVPEEYRLGVSAHWRNFSKDVWVISNPYLRMKGLLSIPSIILSPDSILGLGLLIEGFNINKFQIFGPTSESDKLRILSQWSSNVEMTQHNLGIRYSAFHEPRFFQPPHSLPEISKKIRPFGFDLPAFIQHQSAHSIWGVHEASMKFEQLSNTISSHAPKYLNAPSGKAVLFGSSRGSDYYESLIDSVSSKFAENGFSMTTGGAGGFMKVANRAAFLARVPSIGIPLGSGHQISSERWISDRFKTLTVSAPGYEFRIPLLLQNQEGVLIAPGGSGTMKELATTFVMASSNLRSESQGTPFLCFLSKEYYGTLVQGLQDLPLPKLFKERIVLMDSIEDVENFLALAHLSLTPKEEESRALTSSENSPRTPFFKSD